MLTVYRSHHSNSFEVRVDTLGRLTSRPVSIFGLGFLCVLFLAGCPASPPPQTEDLIKTNPPTFGGKSRTSLTAPSSSYVASGECDTGSYGLEYSTDKGATWKELVGGCPGDGKFSITVVVSPRVNLQVRAKTKFSVTDVAFATITLALPPTSPIGELATSSRSSNEDEAGSQNSISSGISAGPNGPISSGSHTIDVGVVGAVYVQ